MSRLQAPTPSHWVDLVLNDFDTFLLDHAYCERKASALAMSLAAHYRDKPVLVKEMINLAIEELEHFRDVYEVITQRGLQLQADDKDLYVNKLLKHMRKTSDWYLLDRLLIGGVIEARGCERFGLVMEALPTGELKDFYRTIAQAEARHAGLFIRLAKLYYDADDVEARADELFVIEAEVMQSVPLRAIMH